MADEDRELFEAAMSDAPAQEPEPQAPQGEEAAAPEPKADATGRLHGEQGKFVPKTPKAEQQPVQAAPVVEAQQQQPEHRVPLSEHLSEREKRQAAERRAEEFERQLAFMRQQQQKPPEPPKPAPDIFEDPQGFVGNLRSEFQQAQRHQEINFSLRLAHKEYKGDFETAYQSALSARQQGDPAVDAILASSDPGEALMRWHRSRTLLDKTGGDLDGFLQKHTDGLLSDEAFLARAAEAIRARSNGGQPNGQRSVVQLPPSLNRVPAAGSAFDDKPDMSDAALFRDSMR